MRKIDITTFLNYIFILYAFVLPLSRASVAIASVLIVVLFASTKDIRSYTKQILSNRASLSILLFILYYYTMLLFAPMDQLKDGVRYLLPFLYLLPATIASVVLYRDTIYKMTIALLLGIFISEIVSYGIYFGLWEKGKVLVIDPSPFMHHIQYSTFLAFGIIVALYRILHTYPIAHKVLYGIFLLSSIGTLFLIKGRTGQVAFIVTLFVVAFVSFEKRIKATLISILLSVGLLFVAYHLSDTFKERIAMAQSDIINMQEHNNYGTSLGYRVGVTILSLKSIERYPIFGTGVVDAMPSIQAQANIRFPDDYWLKRANHLQNQYLQVVVEAGLVGLSFLLYMLYQISQITIISTEYRTMKITLMSIYILTMLSDIQLHVQFTIGLFAIVVGMLLAQSRVDQESMTKGRDE